MPLTTTKMKYKAVTNGKTKDDVVVEAKVKYNVLVDAKVVVVDTNGNDGGNSSGTKENDADGSSKRKLAELLLADKALAAPVQVR